MDHVVLVLLRDGLAFPSGSVAEAEYACLVYARVPEGWVVGELPAGDDELWWKGPVLTETAMAALLEAMYGKGWTDGNEDGSRYVVLSSGTRLLNPARAGEKPWLLDDPGSADLKPFHFVADGGGFRSVSVDDV